MANELLLFPLHQIQSALGLKVEAKPGGPRPRERCQGLAVMHGREVAGLPRAAGLLMGLSQRRASPFRAKFVLAASFQTGRDAVDAVGGALLPQVRHAIMSPTRNPHPTDEVPRSPAGLGRRVKIGYKSHTKGWSHAPVAGTVSPRPRFQGCQQRQSRLRNCGGRVPLIGPRAERPNPRVSRGSFRFMGRVSPATQATQWPGGTSSRQVAGLLRDGPQYPGRLRATVRSL